MAINFIGLTTETVATKYSLAGALDIEPESYFQDFDDFLSVLTARKRKMIKKERNKVSQLFSFYWKRGNEITDDELEAFYLSYQSTYLKRGRAGYLNKTFFKQIFSTMANKVRLLLCNYEDKVVASALYFVDDETLYGRYWGALGEFEQLHFEACYYQGIEFCIEHKLKRFNPGTQGEHKIARGFKPIETNSLHTLALEPFHNAVEQFCIEEALHNSSYMQACDERLPYKKADN
ncbi:GNAT family N-acetyltransferase [Psychrosphaera haliotis]|uniref:GNAT family N-acetyltransferase n=1 Tax=Psychrosphaera haliotis TaxID=555083 RepID=UPI0018C81263|nr:GNAT family N-acetyltransferase [Psychrosphaera haliotis]